MLPSELAEVLSDTSFCLTPIRFGILVAMSVLLFLYLEDETTTQCHLRKLSLEARIWCHRLHLSKVLGLSMSKLLHDMKLIEQQYSNHPYHGPHHAADVVGKCGAMLRRDKAKLRRVLRVRMGKGGAGGISERKFAVFQLAVILAAAVHDAGHPSLGNNYLKMSQQHKFQKCGLSAERWSVHWFTSKFLKQQSFLNDLTLAEREQVVSIVSFAVLKTDMQAHADVLGMAQQVLKEKDAKKRMQLLAALLLHTADLANGADSWSISKLWARWCHQEFHAQGDTSRAQHPELAVPSFNDRAQADVPLAQLGFIRTFVKPCYNALWAVAPASAALGLCGCLVNSGMCRLTMLWQGAEQKVMDVCGAGKLPRLL
ncbi:hypothetical protein OEZ86_006341 [Tetradesmus obliquus]|nr:hypothetical protein OEZ86_006341 [Tetradesmus obliquus]